MFRGLLTAALAALVLAGLTPQAARAAAQKKTPENPTAEQVAETVVLVYGARERLSQIRRTGVERGRFTRTAEDGRTEEVVYERTFKRGETFEKDKIRLDQRKPTREYSLVLNDGNVFGVVAGGTQFVPRQEDVGIFMADRVHGVETLLRYKESGATITFAGKENQKGLELWKLDLEDKEKRRTRYYVSAKTGKVLWLEYEEAGDGGRAVKFRRTFHDYRVVQGTFYPYRSVLYADDRQIEESQVMTVTFGVKLEDATFLNPQSAAALP